MKIRKINKTGNVSNICRFLLLLVMVVVMGTGCHKPIQAPTYDEEVEE